MAYEREGPFKILLVDQMAKVLPSSREKKRYLVFEVIGKSSCTDAVSAVKDSFTRLFGTLELAKAAIAGMKSSNSRCMVRVNRKHVERLKASLIMVENIKNSAVILRSIGVSGSVKGAVSKYLNGA